MQDQFSQFTTKKNLTSLLVLAILVLAIPIGINLVRQQQILKSKAAGEQVTFASPNVEARTGPNGSPVTVAVDQTVGVNIGIPTGWSYTPTVTLRDLKGTYDLTYTLKACNPIPSGGCGVNTIYPHTMDINAMDTTTGVFSGFGHFNPSPTITWTLSNGLETSSGAVTFHIAYDSSTYTIDNTGTLASDGSISGTATSSSGQSFTFIARLTSTASRLDLIRYYNATTSDYWETTSVQTPPSPYTKASDSYGSLLSRDDGSGVVPLYSCLKGTDHYNSLTPCALSDSNNAIIGYVYPTAHTGTHLLTQCKELPGTTPTDLRTTYYTDCYGHPEEVVGTLGYAYDPPSGATLGPIAEWKLDDGSGTTMKDSAGSSNGTYIGGNAIWKSGTSCVQGACLQFGSIFQDYLQIPDANLKPQQITVSVWAKSTAATWNEYGWILSNRNGYIMHPWKGSKQMTFYVFVNNAWGYANLYLGNQVPALDITKWHHYVGTFDGVNVKLYVDGQLKGTNPVAGVIAFNNPGDQYLTIGKDDNTDGGTNLVRFGDGFIDEVRIYNYALDANAVSALYSSYPRPN